MNDQSQMMNQQQQQQQQQPPPQMMSQPQIQMMLMNNQSNPPPQMLNRSYNSNKLWSSQQQQPQQITPLDPNMKFQSAPLNPNYALSKLGGRSNWKGKKLSDKRNKDVRRMEKPNNIINSNNNTKAAVVSGPSNSGGGGGGYKPPSLHELQSQNRLKARKFFYPNNKKKFNNMNNNNRFAPYAPRNTTSFIIRAKKAGGIAELVSPCPVTPAVLPTPIFSPSREVLGDMAKEEWGVDGYGSMKGLIRLRNEAHDDEEEDENGNGGGDGSSESDVEEHVEVERRLDHDLSRFEMIYPNYGGVEYNNVLENRVDDQDSHIAQLEEENLILKKRLFLMEREMGDLRRRLLFLERQNHVMEDVNEEVVENGSDNESEGGSDVPPPMMRRESNEDIVEYVSGNRSGNVGVDAKEEEEEEENYRASYNEGISVRDVCMEEFVPDEVDAKVKTDVKGEEEKNELVPNEVIAEKKEAKDEENVRENVGKDDEMRIEFLRDGVIAVNDGAKGEEAADKASAKENDFKVEYAKNEFVSDEVMAPVIDDTNNEDRRSEFVQAGGIVEKDESKNEELGNMCSEKSIGDGD